MDGTKRLAAAFQLQFRWVQVLFTDRQRYTGGERKRVYVFMVLHFCFVLVLFGHILHPFISWVLAFLMQAAALTLSMLHLAYVEDYAEKMNNAMELEKDVNPIMVAEISVRCFIVLHCILMHSWVLMALGVVELLYDLFVARQRSFLVDATTVWKEIEALRLDSRIRLGYQGFLVLCTIAHLLYKLMTA